MTIYLNRKVLDTEPRLEEYFKYIDWVLSSKEMNYHKVHIIDFYIRGTNILNILLYILLAGRQREQTLKDDFKH